MFLTNTWWTLIMTFYKKSLAAIYKTDIYLKQFVWFSHQKLTRLCNKINSFAEKEDRFFFKWVWIRCWLQTWSSRVAIDNKPGPYCSGTDFKLWCKHQIWCTYSVWVILHENNAGHAKFQYGRHFSRWPLWAILKSFYLPWDHSSWSEKMIHCALWACTIYSTIYS